MKYFVRPYLFAYAVYKYIDSSHSQVVFTGTIKECYDKAKELNK